MACGQWCVCPSVERGWFYFFFTNNRPHIVVDFYNHINLLYGSITEFCSPTSCPEMKATDEFVQYTLGFMDWS